MARAEHEEAIPLVEDPSIGSLGRSGAGRHVIAILTGAIALVAVVCLGSVAVRSQSGAVQSPASMDFVRLQAGGTTFLLDSVVGPISSVFISASQMSGGLTSATLGDMGDKELKQKGFIGGSGGVPSSCNFCPSPTTELNSNNVCCYEILSGNTQLNSGTTKDLEKFPNLALKVKIGYERFLEPSMINYVRDMKGVVAKERASVADTLRDKGVLDKKQLSSANADELLAGAGLPEGTAAANKQDMSALSNMPDEVSADKQAQNDELSAKRAAADLAINGAMEKAKAERSQAKEDAQAMYDQAKAEAEAEMQKVKATAQEGLDKTTAKLAELELGSADLKATEASLKSTVEEKLQGSTELTKGVKLNTWQLIARNAIFGGRHFHGGICEEESKVRFDVAEFTADALAELPNPNAGTKWTDANVVGGGSSAQRSATVVSAGYSKDLLASLVTRSSPDTATEHSFSVTSSRDEQQATRMFETYGSSSSQFVQKETSFGMSFGIPGLFSFGGGYSQTKSKSSASSEMGESDQTAQYSQTGTQFTQVQFYEEPRMVVMVPRSMLQATGMFTNFTKYIYDKAELTDANKRLFFSYGTHLCPKVTLGGRWRITARAISVSSRTYADLSAATSQAISETETTGKSGQAAMGANVKGVEGGQAAGGGSGSSDTSESSSAGGAAEKESDEARDVTVTVEQEWTGGQSGGTPAAWRASLSEEENSNWKVLKFTFSDCIPVWAFYPEGMLSQKVSACMYWYYTEIETSPVLDAQAQEELMQEVPRKCMDDPDTTYLGPLAAAFRKAMVREQERTAAVDVKLDEHNMIAPQYQSRTSCSEVVSVSNMMPTKGLKDAGECVANKGLKGCQDICAERDTCRGFWFSAAGKCCPKETWDYRFDKNMDADPGNFYRCTAAVDKVTAMELNAKALTDWGSWSGYSSCPHKERVTGIRQRLEQKGQDDDTALNGIRLACKGGTSIEAEVGQWGDWSVLQSCEDGAYLVGYELRSVESRGSSDDYGAIGIKGVCSDGERLHADNRPSRGWDSSDGAPAREARCPPGYYINSLKTLVESNQGGRRRKGDDTALNDVKFQCMKEDDGGAASPFIGASGSGCSKYTTLDDKEDCMEAASLMGLTWQHDEASPYMPSGCYSWGPTDSQQYSVYFNFAPGGIPEPDIPEPDTYAFTSICYVEEVPFVFKFNGCAVSSGGWEINFVTKGEKTFSLCATACEQDETCTGFEITGCERSRQCDGECKTFSEDPEDLVLGGCDATGATKTYVTSTTPTTTQSKFYTLVGAGIVTPEKWNVGDLSPGKGVEACYEAVQKDPECEGEYFMYAARSDLNCGCTMAGRQEVVVGDVGELSDYYKYTTTTTTSTASRGIEAMQGAVWAPFVQDVGGWAEIPASEGIGSAALAFTIKCTGSATATFKAEIIAPDGNSDSFRLQLDDGERLDWHTSQGLNWFWSATSPSVSITAGLHTVKLRGREGGIKIRALKFESGMDEANCDWQQTRMDHTTNMTSGAVFPPFVHHEGEGGGFAEIPEGDGVIGADLVFTVVCTGNANATLRAQIIAPDGNADSFFLQLDDGEQQDWHTGRGSSWFWSSESPKIFITEGQHNIILHGREDGIKIRALSFDEGFMATGCQWQRNAIVWARPLTEGMQCNDREDDGPAVLHWLYSRISFHQCKLLCEADPLCAAILYRSSTSHCATYNERATILSHPDRVRIENGWSCYTRGTTYTTTNLLDACYSQCEGLVCSGGWRQPLPTGDQCNDKEDVGPNVLHWIYERISVNECKEKCENSSNCSAIAYQQATNDCATYIKNATILTNPQSVRKEPGWSCYTKIRSTSYALEHTGAFDGGAGQRWKRGPGGPKESTAPLGEEPYTSGEYEVLFQENLSTCQQACVCRKWCKGFTFVSGKGYEHPDFQAGDCQLMSQLVAMETNLVGVDSYRKIGCNPNTCDGLVCKPGTAIDVLHVGGKTEINYGVKDGAARVLTLTENVSSEEDCKKEIGRVYAFEVRYAAYENGTCHKYGDYYPDAVALHNQTNRTVQRAWVQQTDGVCCAKDQWNCCGTGDMKYTNREYCPRTSALCEGGKCSQNKTCHGESPLIDAESC